MSHEENNQNIEFRDSLYKLAPEQADQVANGIQGRIDFLSDTENNDVGSKIELQRINLLQKRLIKMGQNLEMSEEDSAELKDVINDLMLHLPDSNLDLNNIDKQIYYDVMNRLNLEERDTDEITNDELIAAYRDLDNVLKQSKSLDPLLKEQIGNALLAFKEELIGREMHRIDMTPANELVAEYPEYFTLVRDEDSGVYEVRALQSYTYLVKKARKYPELLTDEDKEVLNTASIKMAQCTSNKKDIIESVLLNLETDEKLLSPYRGNKYMGEGKLPEAKKEYLDAITNGDLSNAQVAEIETNLKSIATFEAEEVLRRIDLYRQSLKVDAMNEGVNINSFNESDTIATLIYVDLSLERNVAQLALEIIKKNNNSILTFEDAIEEITKLGDEVANSKGANSGDKDIEIVEQRLTELGFTDKQIRDTLNHREDGMGEPGYQWKRISMWLKPKEKPSYESFDNYEFTHVIENFLGEAKIYSSEERRELDYKRATEIQDHGIYLAAEKSYERYFDGLISEMATGDLALDEYRKNFFDPKHPRHTDRQDFYDERMDLYKKYYFESFFDEKKPDYEQKKQYFDKRMNALSAGKDIPEQQKKNFTEKIISELWEIQKQYYADSIISEKWKEEVYLKVREKVNSGKYPKELADKWNEFDDSFFDKTKYTSFIESVKKGESAWQMIGMTEKDWNIWWTKRAFDIAALGAMGMASAAVGEGITVTLLRRALVEGGEKVLGEKGSLQILRYLLIKEVGPAAAEAAIKEGLGPIAGRYLLPKLLVSLVKSGQARAFVNLLGAEAFGFAAETLVFAEMNLIYQSLSSANPWELGNYDSHVKSFGNFAKVLGVVKAIGACAQGTKFETSTALSYGVMPIVEAEALTAIDAISDGSDTHRALLDNWVITFGMRLGHGLGRLSGDSPGARSKFMRDIAERGVRESMGLPERPVKWDPKYEGKVGKEKYRADKERADKDKSVVDPASRYIYESDIGAEIFNGMTPEQVKDMLAVSKKYGITPEWWGVCCDNVDAKIGLIEKLIKLPSLKVAKEEFMRLVESGNSVDVLLIDVLTSQKSFDIQLTPEELHKLFGNPDLVSVGMKLLAKNVMESPDFARELSTHIKGLDAKYSGQFDRLIDLMITQLNEGLDPAGLAELQSLVKSLSGNPEAQFYVFMKALNADEGLENLVKFFDRFGIRDVNNKLGAIHNLNSGFDWSVIWKSMAKHPVLTVALLVYLGVPVTSVLSGGWTLLSVAGALSTPLLILAFAHMLKKGLYDPRKAAKKKLPGQRKAIEDAKPTLETWGLDTASIDVSLDRFLTDAESDHITSLDNAGGTKPKFDATAVGKNLDEILDGLKDVDPKTLGRTGKFLRWIFGYRKLWGAKAVDVTSTLGKFKTPKKGKEEEGGEHEDADLVRLREYAKGGIDVIKKAVKDVSAANETIIRATQDFNTAATALRAESVDPSSVLPADTTLEQAEARKTELTNERTTLNAEIRKTPGDTTNLVEFSKNKAKLEKERDIVNLQIKLLEAVIVIKKNVAKISEAESVVKALKTTLEHIIGKDFGVWDATKGAYVDSNPSGGKFGALVLGVGTLIVIAILMSMLKTCSPSGAESIDPDEAFKQFKDGYESEFAPVRNTTTFKEFDDNMKDPLDVLEPMRTQYEKMNEKNRIDFFNRMKPGGNVETTPVDPGSAGGNADKAPKREPADDNATMTFAEAHDEFLSRVSTPISIEGANSKIYDKEYKELQNLINKIADKMDDKALKTSFVAKYKELMKLTND